MTSTLPDRLIDLDEAAAYLHVSKSWLGNAVRKGEVPATRVGRYVRFSREDIEAIIEQGKTANTARAVKQHRSTARRGGV